MCRGSSRSVEPTLSMAEWLKREIQCLEPLPEIFRERQYELEYAAINTDFNRLDAADAHYIRTVLRELLAEMRESIEHYRFWMQLYDIFDRNGVPLPFERSLLENELDQAERDSLAFDTARD